MVFKRIILPLVLVALLLSAIRIVLMVYRKKPEQTDKVSSAPPTPHESDIQQEIQQLKFDITYEESLYFNLETNDFLSIVQGIVQAASEYGIVVESYSIIEGEAGFGLDISFSGLSPKVLAFLGFLRTHQPLLALKTMDVSRSENSLDISTVIVPALFDNESITADLNTDIEQTILPPSAIAETVFDYKPPRTAVVPAVEAVTDSITESDQDNSVTWLHIIGTYRRSDGLDVHAIRDDRDGSIRSLSLSESDEGWHIVSVDDSSIEVSDGNKTYKLERPSL